VILSHLSLGGFESLFSGKDKAAHGGAAEASADHSIFSAKFCRLAFPLQGRPPPRHLNRWGSVAIILDILLLSYWADSSRGANFRQEDGKYIINVTKQTEKCMSSSE